MKTSIYFHGGPIYPQTGNPQAAEALLIEGSQVMAIGPAQDLEPGLGSDVVKIDLNNRCIVPGLVDAHIHLEKYTRWLSMVDCEQPTIAECLAQVAHKAEQSDANSWVLGHGWNQNLWGRFGTLQELDEAVPNRPAYLTAKSLHAAWVNSKALELAGIDSSMADPEDGAIDRDRNGNPTGILFEGAMKLVASRIPAPSPNELADNLISAQAKLSELGLTGVHDFDGPECLRALQMVRDRNQLQLRIVKNIPAAQLAAARSLGLRSGFGDRWIRIGNIKVFADGALGPRTAAMLQPYEGEPENQGMLLLDEEALVEVFEQAVESGFGMTVHAIGDRANHEVLNAYSHLRQMEDRNGYPHRRHRIEHLQLLHSDDMARVAELDLIASMQPIHATSDMEMADRYWGARTATAYAWRSQLDLGAQLAFGSDAPVELPDPILGLHAAVTRQRSDGSPGQDGWHPEERLSISDALAAYTSGPAYAAGTEAWQGSLAAGYAADLVVFDRDPYQLESSKLLGLSVEGTMVAGKWSYREF